MKKKPQKLHREKNVGVELRWSCGTEAKDMTGRKSLTLSRKKDVGLLVRIKWPSLSPQGYVSRLSYHRSSTAWTLRLDWVYAFSHVKCASHFCKRYRPANRWNRSNCFLIRTVPGGIGLRCRTYPSSNWKELSVSPVNVKSRRLTNGFRLDKLLSLHCYNINNVWAKLHGLSCLLWGWWR